MGHCSHGQKIFRCRGLIQVLAACGLCLLLAVYAFADGWFQYYGQNEVRDVAKTKDGVLWAALGHGLQERSANGQAKIYTPGNNGLEAADFVQVFALPSGDIIAGSGSGILVRKNKNSRQFETISSSYAEKKRSLLRGLGQIAENILVLPFNNSLSFFDYSTNRSVITLAQLGASSLEEYAIKRVAVKGDTVWVELENSVWKRRIKWSEIHKDNFLADPNSWTEAMDKKIPFAPEPKPVDSTSVNFPMKKAKTISLISGEYAIAWGNECSHFSKMQHSDWGWPYDADQSGYENGNDQKNYATKSLALLPGGNFAAGIWGPGVLTYNNTMIKTGWFHSTTSRNACPTEFSSTTQGYTIVQGLVAAPDFSGYIFSYVSDSNYGLGFVDFSGTNPASCSKSDSASSHVAFSIIARGNSGAWEVYAAWRNSLESNSGGVDFYEVSNRGKFQALLKKKWALPFGSPIDFAFDSKGVLWAVSQSEIFYLEKEKGEWQKPVSIRGFGGGTISALEADAQNGLWVSTLGDGAYFFSQASDSPDSLRGKQFKVKDGLLSDWVYDIAIDTVKGKVYFANDLGLSVYSAAHVRNGQNHMQNGAPKTIAYPNPFRPKEHSAVTIDYITEKSSVYILDAFGKRVRFFKGSELKGGAAIWDGKNESGKTVAPGVYHYIAADGKKVAKGKIIVER